MELIFSNNPKLIDKIQGYVQAHTGAQRFAMVSGLNDMFPGNGVQRCATGFEICFLLYGGCLKNVSPISSNMYINYSY